VHTPIHRASAWQPGWVDRPLEPDAEQWRALATTVVDHLGGVLDALPDAPASDFTDVQGVLADPELRRPPPEQGRPLEELLALVDRAAAPGLRRSSGHCGPSGSSKWGESRVGPAARDESRARPTGPPGYVRSRHSPSLIPERPDEWRTGPVWPDDCAIGPTTPAQVLSGSAAEAVERRRTARST
jgi:hypothetical protein